MLFVGDVLASNGLQTQRCCLVFLNMRDWDGPSGGNACVLEKFCSGLSYTAVGQKSNVNESTIYIKVSLAETHLK